MSDFLFSNARRAEGELRRVLERYVGHVSVSVDERHGAWGSLAVARGPADPPEVVVEEGGWLSVLVGDPIVRIGADVPAPSSLGARRRGVHALLCGGQSIDWPRSVDNGFAALAVDTESGGGVVVTDMMAFIPVLSARSGDGAMVLGTHLDAVAAAAGRDGDIDLVSAADLLANLVSAFPYTLYRGVEQLPPATARRFAAGAWQGAHAYYWTPAPRTAYRSVGEAAAALREAVRADVAAGCQGAAEVGVLLSGGEDSRAVLGAMPTAVGVHGFVYADWESREVRVARAAARAYGARVTVGWRTPDHYMEGMEAVSSLIGGQNLFMDVHGWGFHERLGIQALPRVFGGFSADSLLKGSYDAPARPGRDTPVPTGLRPELVREAAARHEAHRERVERARGAPAAEWYRLWPFSMRKHPANFHGNRRMFANHEPFHAAAVVDLAASVPAAWKQRRRLFHAAMKPLFRPSWYLPHSSWRFPYFGAAANVPLWVGLRATRGVRALVAGEVRARQQPWPKWRTVARSDAAAARFREHAPWDSPLREVFTDPAPDAVLASMRGAWHPLGQLMLLQLSYLTRIPRAER